MKMALSDKIVKFAPSDPMDVLFSCFFYANYPKSLVNKGGCSAQKPPNSNVTQCTKLPYLSTLANLFPTLFILYRLT